MAENDVVPLSRFAPGALASRRPARRLEAIFGSADPEAHVAALPIQDLYFLIQELGLADAHELVALATPEQVQGFLDLDAWKADRLDDAAVVPWLEALIAAGPERLASTWQALDPDLTALLIQRWVRVYNIVEEELPDWEEPPFIPTPDRFFMLKVTATDADTVRVVGELVDRLYRADAALARHTIRTASSEPAAELEEMAHRWRSGRMQDLGFADPLDALEVYQPIDIASVKIGERTEDAAPDAQSVTLPTLFQGPMLKQPFLARVLAGVTDAAWGQRLENALALLLNRVLAANRVRPSDTVGAAAAPARGAATRSRGRETGARGGEASGAEALRTIALVRLHRVGHSVVQKLAAVAGALAPRAGRAEEPHLSVLTALTKPRPELARVLDEPSDLGTRPFAEVADVRKAARALGVLAAQVAIVREALSVDPAALGAAVTLGDVGRTAILHILFGAAPTAAALRTEDVRRFAASLEEGRVPAPARATIAKALEDLHDEKKIARPQEFVAAVSGWIGDLERELGRLDPLEPPDKRFVGGLLLE
jgi:hypothetical protein